MLVSMFLRLALCFFLCSTFFTPLLAQFEAKKVSHSQTKNPILLSRAICDSLQSDSEKVIALAAWIVENIKYDYYGLLHHKLKNSSPETTLRKKKGLCGEFADLFNALCLVQGIKSQTVIGYTRSYNYEPFDSLIRAEHAWNVVFLDGEWRPLDISWSVGYLKQKKQWLRNNLYLWLGIPYKIKYQFVNQVNTDYLLIPPERFIETHAPLLPFWQLLKRPVPIKKFEVAQVENYIRDHREDEFQDYNYKAEIDNYLSLSDRDKALKGAKMAHLYNPQNNRILGLGYLNFSNLYSNEIYHLLDPEQKVALLDSCIVMLDSADAYFDNHNKDTRLARKQMDQRNKNFKQELRASNKDISKSLKNSQRRQKRQIRRSKMDVKKDSRNRKKLNVSQLKIKKQDLEKVERSSKRGKSQEEKVRGFQSEINQIDSLWSELNQKDFSWEDSIISQNTKQINILHNELVDGFQNNVKLTKNAKIYRFGYDNYSRLFLDKLKQKIISQQAHNQSLYDELSLAYEKMRELKELRIKHNDSISELLEEKLKLYEKLKKASFIDLNEDKLFSQCKDLILDQQQKSLEEYKSMIKVSRFRIDQVVEYKKPVSNTLKTLKKELKRENKRYALHRKIHQNTYKHYSFQTNRLIALVKEAIEEHEAKKVELEEQLKE